MFHVEHFSYQDVRTITYYSWRYKAEALGLGGFWGTSGLSPGFSRSVDDPPTFDVLHAPRFRTARNLGHPALVLTQGLSRLYAFDGAIEILSPNVSGEKN